MKFMRTFEYITLGAVATIFMASCAEERVKPTLPARSEFGAPVLTNAASNTPVVFTPEMAADKFETFEWETAEYGLPVAVTYLLQIDNDEDFSSPSVLSTTSGNSVDVTVDDFNDAMLAMGLSTATESTVFLRVTSTIDGLESDPDEGVDNAPLVSGAISRTATPFRISNCGNFCTIALIGSASPGGWDVDSDLRLANPAESKYDWTITLYLAQGEVKFRANDQWTATSNWGGTAFPEGTGALDGPNISIATSGYYTVDFNDFTGAYTFTLLTTPEYSTVGMIGSATAGGWDADTDLTQDPNDAHIWTGIVTLMDGQAKFRAENAWTNNWGGASAPSGQGVQDGPNIPVEAGTYSVRFNDATGEYFLNAQDRGTPFNTIGIIGSGTEGGWDSDTDLIRNPANPFVWSGTIEISDGEAKFRANDAWSANWGASTFPSGISVQDGPNIPTTDGDYFVTFNSGTGEYSFLK
jgi:hypothetical protein